MPRNTYDAGRFREEDKTPSGKPIDWSAKSPEVHPKLAAFRQRFSRIFLPMDYEREIRNLRAAIVDLAADVYSTPNTSTVADANREDK
jgi:hypothetical protein